jgi:hypothetical protein
MRITNSDQLHRGMVLTLCSLSHPNTEGHVVTEVLNDGFRAVRLTNATGRSKHHDSLYHFLDYQIISVEILSVADYAIWWAESTGEKTEEEVQAMLDDDCLVCK